MAPKKATKAAILDDVPLAIAAKRNAAILLGTHGTPTQVPNMEETDPVQQRQEIKSSRQRWGKGQLQEAAASSSQSTSSDPASATADLSSPAAASQPKRKLSALSDAVDVVGGSSYAAQILALQAAEKEHMNRQLDNVMQNCMDQMTSIKQRAASQMQHLGNAAVGEDAMSVATLVPVTTKVQLDARSAARTQILAQGQDTLRAMQELLSLHAEPQGILGTLGAELLQQLAASEQLHEQLRDSFAALRRAAEAEVVKKSQEVSADMETLREEQQKEAAKAQAAMVVAVGKVARQQQEEVEREKAMLTEELQQLQEKNQRLLDCNRPPEHNQDIDLKEQRLKELAQGDDFDEERRLLTDIEAVELPAACKEVVSAQSGPPPKKRRFWFAFW